MLKLTRYERIKPYISLMNKEHVSSANTLNTDWYFICDDKTKQKVGVCALLYMKNKARIKSVYVLPAYRGMGYGNKAVDDMLSIAKSKTSKVEVLAYNKDYYLSKGFVLVSQQKRRTAKPVYKLEYEIV